jgi:hypothetical protein
LDTADTETLGEIFWDLFLDRIITIERLADYGGFPRFRLHADGMQNIEKQLKESQGQ